MLNHDFRSLQHRQHLRAISLIFFGALCCVQVNAQTILSPSGVDAISAANYLARRDSWVSGVTVNGAPTTIVPSSTSLTAPNGRVTLSTSANATVGGVTIPVKSTISATAAATGKLALALAKVAGPVGVAVAAYDLFKSVQGVTVKYVSPGVLDITKITKGISCTSNCWNYSTGNGYAPTIAAAAALSQAVDSRYRYIGCNETTLMCEWLHIASNSPIYNAATKRSVPPYETASESVGTEADVITAASTTTAYPPNVVENMAKAAIESGIAPEVDETTKKISGPSTVGSPKVTTKTNPDGSTETTTEKSNITYQGNNIKIDNSSVVTNYNPTTNSTTTTTTTTENPDKPVDPSKTDCEKFPDAIGCQKIDFDTPTGDIPKSTRNITYAAENLGFGGGSCPADAYVTPHGMSQIKVFDWVSACGTITSYVKPMMLALAGFAALMIIFAGARPE